MAIRSLATNTGIGFIIAGIAVFAAQFIIWSIGAGDMVFYLFIGGIAITIGVIVLIRDAFRNYHERHPLRSSDGAD